MRVTYRYELTRVVALVVLGLLLGALTGEPLFSLLTCLLLYLGTHLYHLLRLTFLSDNRRYVKPPYPSGLWGEIYQALGLQQARSRKRKRGLVRFAARFREAAAAIPDGLVILDAESRVLWANPATRTLLGCGWPENEGQAIAELIHYPPLIEYIESGEYTRPVDFIPTHNRAIVLSLRVTPFGGKKRQRLLVARDITKIYHLNQIRRDFVANVSHELRTPLTVVNGFIENLLDAEATPEAFKRPLSLMHSQSKRMNSIVEDLMTLSRLEMDEKASDQMPLDVPELIDSVLEDARALSQGRHLFRSHIEQDLWLLASYGDMHSAVSNLVFNAVKHTPVGTEIQVRWETNEAGPALTVTDRGCGIAPEHIPRLTERFYRVDRGRSRASGGTGLGLAIVKHVLNRHEAQLLIHSKEGQGSSFCCQFPPELALTRPGQPTKGPLFDPLEAQVEP